MHLITTGDANDKTQKPNFGPEFRLEVAQLVVDNGYSHESAAKAFLITAEQIEICELKKRIKRIYKGIF